MPISKHVTSLVECVYHTLSGIKTRELIQLMGVVGRHVEKSRRKTPNHKKSIHTKKSIKYEKK